MSPAPHPPGISSLAELRRFHAPGAAPAWQYAIVQRELNGGKTSEDQLDILEEHPEVTALTISGLDQRVFESLVKRFGQRLSALHLWKCPRLSDLSPLEGIAGLSHLAIFWNQRATRFWDFRRTRGLKALHFTDFNKLERLDDLALAAPSLETLEFGNANFSRYAIASLEPLGTLGALKSLAFNACLIGDGRIQPLARLQGLDELDFPSSQFTVEQLAWLRAHLPDTLDSTALAPVRQLDQPLQRGEKSLDILVNGKRMPFLSSTADARRVADYTARFKARVAYYREHPDEEPPNGNASNGKAAARTD